MRYYVRGRVKPGKERALLEAIERGTLGAGSVAEGEYLRTMHAAPVRRRRRAVGRSLLLQ